MIPRESAHFFLLPAGFLLCAAGAWMLFGRRPRSIWGLHLFFLGAGFMATGFAVLGTI